jgi:hypothetical protein
MTKNIAIALCVLGAVFGSAAAAQKSPFVERPMVRQDACDLVVLPEMAKAARFPLSGARSDMSENWDSGCVFFGANSTEPVASVGLIYGPRSKALYEAAEARTKGSFGGPLYIPSVWEDQGRRLVVFVDPWQRTLIVLLRTENLDPGPAGDAAGAIARAALAHLRPPPPPDLN